MYEYWFLYVLGFIGILFAVVQDLRTREIANWLTFSLIAFVLAYRALYSIYSNNFMFFIYGLMGVILFVGLGYLFYYSKIFAGGDAKLLFGIGGILPYQNLMDFVYYGFGFVLLLFTSGVIYTLVYSGFLIRKNKAEFRKSFYQQIKKRKYLFIISLVLAILIYLSKSGNDGDILIYFSLFILLSPILFAYVKAIELSCMIQLVSPMKLTEGDWLEQEVKVKDKVIKKKFSGLTWNEILLLRQQGKKVWIKTGVPFAPAFLIAITLFLFSLRYPFWELL
jgi:Flp pilus assembly protein protease CpaA